MKIGKFFLKKKYNILIIQPIGSFSGSLKSLENYIKHIYKKYNFIFLTQRGFSANILNKYGKVYKSFGIPKFDNTLNSHYSGIRWLLLIREFFFIPFAVYNLLRIKHSIKNLDLIHLNEITGIPTAIIAKFIFDKPLIVHVRSLNNLKKKLTSKIFLKILYRFADKILVIDKEVLKTLKSKKKCTIVRNILDIKIKNSKLNLNSEYLYVGYIGTFLKYKGVEKLIEAVEDLVRKNYKIKLILAGSILKRNTFFSKISEILNLENNIDTKILKQKFIINLGFLKNINKFYKKIHILCFPSSLNAAGRQIFEAGFFSKPVIICLKKNSDTFINNFNGIAYKNFNSVNQLQKSIIYFYKNKKLINKMGINGRKMAIKNHSKNFNIKKMTSIYNNLINNVHHSITK